MLGATSISARIVNEIESSFIPIDFNYNGILKGNCNIESSLKLLIRNIVHQCATTLETEIWSFLEQCLIPSDEDKTETGDPIAVINKPQFKETSLTKNIINTSDRFNDLKDSIHLNSSVCTSNNMSNHLTPPFNKRPSCLIPLHIIEKESTFSDIENRPMNDFKPEEFKNQLEEELEINRTPLPKQHSLISLSNRTRPSGLRLIRIPRKTRHQDAVDRSDLGQLAHNVCNNEYTQVNKFLMGHMDTNLMNDFCPTSSTQSHHVPSMSSIHKQNISKLKRLSPRCNIRQDLLLSKKKNIFFKSQSLNSMSPSLRQNGIIDRLKKNGWISRRRQNKKKYGVGLSSQLDDPYNISENSITTFIRNSLKEPERSLEKKDLTCITLSHKTLLPTQVTDQKKKDLKIHEKIVSGNLNQVTIQSDTEQLSRQETDEHSFVYPNEQTIGIQDQIPCRSKCSQCEDFYQAVREPQFNACLEKQNYSRHHFTELPSGTPAGYWDIEFPDT